MMDLAVKYLVLVAVIAVCLALGVWHFFVVLIDRATNFVGEHAEDFE